MKKIKVLTLVGTRPEIIKLCRVIAELEEHTEHTIVHTGQNFDYELNEVFFEQLGIRKPDFFLDIPKDGSPASAVGNVIDRTDKILREVKPDAFLILGDTNSALGAYAAKRLQIPVFHMEAGNRCFDERVPEEINRRILDHISDINLPYTEHARRYLLAENIRPEKVITTGSPMSEVLLHYKDQYERSSILKDLNLSSRKYFLVSTHREENVDSDRNLTRWLETLNAIAEQYKMPIIVSTHPRTRKKMEAKQDMIKPHTLISFMKPLGFMEYIKLQKEAFCVISDSGTLTEEASILNLPAITIREAHERPEGMDEGTVIMSGLSPKRVLQSIEVVRSHFSEKKPHFKLVGDYAATNVSKKVLRIILSYVDYINANVWKKQLAGSEVN